MLKIIKNNIFYYGGARLTTAPCAYIKRTTHKTKGFTKRVRSIIPTANNLAQQRIFFMTSGPENAMLLFFHFLISKFPQGFVARTYHTPFSNFLFTNLFSIKFLYFFIISSLFPYFTLFVSIFIQSYANNNLHVLTLYW
jgi:hypothetical protein